MPKNNFKLIEGRSDNTAQFLHQLTETVDNLLNPEYNDGIQYEIVDIKYSAAVGNFLVYSALIQYREQEIILPAKLLVEEMIAEPTKPKEKIEELSNKDIAESYIFPDVVNDNTSVKPEPKPKVEKVTNVKISPRTKSTRGPKKKI